MTDTLQMQRRARRLVPALVIALGLLLISAVVIQQVAAQDQGSLKPPFKLIRNASAPSFNQLGPVALPLNAPIIISQTFNSSYIPSSDLNTPGWHESYASDATSQYTWGRVTTGPRPDTVWSVRHNPSGFPQLDPATGTYTNGQQALLIYGPLNLTDYTQLVMTGTYWLDTAVGDYMGVAYSTDGTNWNELYAQGASDPTLSQAQTFYVSLNQVARKPVVWIALTFVSDNDGLVRRGAFVKNVVLRGNSAMKFFLPLLRLDPTPTPRPTSTPQSVYVYDYTFGSGLNTDPQFIEWGGKVTDAACYSTDAGGCQWGQDIVTSGNPGGAVNMYVKGYESIAGASPNNTAPADFELSADFYVSEGKSNARVGLIFGASNGVFGRDNGTPYFDPNRNLYKFDLQFNETNETVMSYYRLQACVNNIDGCTNVVEKSTLPPGLVGNAGSWNNIKVQRLGSNIKVYVNGSLLVNVDDSTHVGAGKYGLFVQTKDLNNPNNPIRIRFDNVRVRSLP